MWASQFAVVEDSASSRMLRRIEWWLVRRFKVSYSLYPSALNVSGRMNNSSSVFWVMTRRVSWFKSDTTCRSQLQGPNCPRNWALEDGTDTPETSVLNQVTRVAITRKTEAFSSTAAEAYDDARINTLVSFLIARCGRWRHCDPSCLPVGTA